MQIIKTESVQLTEEEIKAIDVVIDLFDEIASKSNDDTVTGEAEVISQRLIGFKDFFVI